MAGDEATRRSENELLMQACTVLQTRYERGDSYTDLSATAASELQNTLRAVGMAEDDLEGVDRGEAIALAHRIVDDDSPEHSPLWPEHSG